ncbi:hypothetical protein H7F37_04265 [Winogradskyella sp. PAMC22761]|nr:hypothetical protein H7F37_04265 [Winogradskyella sp. PAMC22761]
MKTLELRQMEFFNGGQAAPWNDEDECNEAALALGGAALIVGFSSWYTGAGAGLALGVSAAAFGLGAYCYFAF